MATLTNTKVKDTFSSILKLSSNTVTSVEKVIEDGHGTSSALSLSTAFVTAAKLKITSPVATTTEATALFIDGTEVKTRDLGTSAFENATTVIASTGISVATSNQQFTITNSAPDQTVALTVGTGLSISGTYPTFDIQNILPDLVTSLTAGTGIGITGTYPNFTVTNSSPDQTVSVSGTSGIAVTGTYPSFTVDGGAVVGTHEETFIGVTSGDYTLNTTPQTVAFSVVDNTNSAYSYHLGRTPAKLTLASSGEYLENQNANEAIIFVDVSAYITIVGNNKDITYDLQKYSSSAWSSLAQVSRSKSASGSHVDSFWKVCVLAQNERLRLLVSSSTDGHVTYSAGNQVKFEVKQLGDIS